MIYDILRQYDHIVPHQDVLHFFYVIRTPQSQLENITYYTIEYF